MINIFDKIKFFLRSPKVVIVAGRGEATAVLAISRVLQRSSEFGKETLVYRADFKNVKELEFLVKKSRLAVLVATHVGEYHPEKEFFAAAENDVADIEKLAEILPAQAYLVLNFDDETVRTIKNKSRARVLTFGFAARADIQATDVVLTQPPSPGTNFKINYQGNIVPVWLPNLFGKEHIYAALAAVAVGEILGLNLVEISDSLKQV